MAFWQTLLIQLLATALVVAMVLGGFFRWVLKPYLDIKVKELMDAAEQLEPRVTQGVKAGVRESLQELPEQSVREPARQFLRFGSGLVENGLSSFLGGSADTERKTTSHPSSDAHRSTDRR
ncbi:hypothetical protein [Marinobacter caseinilyticus]|uniref:hypothetical protein n=1 Tax=Marinobacter caseinilyticus TaxID=2692195 RepID=UPI00140D183B|nr:hypothetical protein [Marinobacter caseinilyticus]